MPRVAPVSSTAFSQEGEGLCTPFAGAAFRFALKARTSSPGSETSYLEQRRYLPQGDNFQGRFRRPELLGTDTGLFSGRGGLLVSKRTQLQFADSRPHGGSSAKLDHERRQRTSRLRCLQNRAGRDGRHSQGFPLEYIWFAQPRYGLSRRWRPVQPAAWPEHAAVAESLIGPTASGGARIALTKIQVYRLVQLRASIRPTVGHSMALLSFTILDARSHRKHCCLRFARGSANGKNR